MPDEESVQPISYFLDIEESAPIGLAYDPAKGFPGKELREYLGYNSSSFPSTPVKQAIANGQDYFEATKVTSKIDRFWRWEGEGRGRRFYRVDRN